MKRLRNHFPHYAVAFILIIGLMIPTAFARDVGPTVIKSGTKTTPYGTITGQIIRRYEQLDYGGLRTLELSATTSINSANPMDEVSVQVSCVYNDTGLPEHSNWTNITATSKNARSTSAEFNLYIPYASAKREVAIFSAHQVISTQAYVLNMNYVYPGSAAAV